MDTKYLKGGKVMQNMDEIYSKYGDIVYKYVFCLTGNEDITEEIVQETFVVAIKDIKKFRGECKISSWLCQISKYIWYKKLKKEKQNKQSPKRRGSEQRIAYPDGLLGNAQALCHFAFCFLVKEQGTNEIPFFFGKLHKRGM